MIYKRKFAILLLLLSFFMAFSLVMTSDDNIYAFDIYIDNPSINLGPTFDYPDTTIPILTPEFSVDYLYSYDSLSVRNQKYGNVYNQYQYTDFVSKFIIERTDGRNIWDDDGYLSVANWTDDGFVETDECINYPANLNVKTTLMPYNYGGFLGTIINSKWQNNGAFEITFGREEDPEDIIIDGIHDLNANTMASGNYRNSGLNPGDETYTLCDCHFTDSPYITVSLTGTAYAENGWWGGSFCFTDMNELISGFMQRANRDWSNSINFDGKYISHEQPQMFNVGNKYYTLKPFVVRVSNLNNYLKVNDVKSDPKNNKSIVAYKDGFYVGCNNGYTKISIEKDFEENYEDYEFIIDNTIPNIQLSYTNTNAMAKLKRDEIIENQDGTRSQNVYGAIFKDQVKISFEESENDSPETATYSFNGGEFQTLSSGQWLDKQGSYVVIVKDLVGNTQTFSFEIDKTNPETNISLLQSAKEYKVSKWYNCSCDTITKSFQSYDTALDYAKQNETSKYVTEYYLENIEDFQFTNLVANNGNDENTDDEVRVGSYWYYKSKSNADLYVYYFDENLLNEVITFYAKKYISSEKYYNNSTFAINEYSNCYEDMFDNICNVNGISAYIIKSHKFVYTGESDSFAIYYDYVDDEENWIEFSYDKPFKEQVNNTDGLYKIKEMDFVGHETIFYVYLDITIPTIKGTALSSKSQIENEIIISRNLIPNNNELSYYFQTFKFDEINDIDKWSVIKIVNPDNRTSFYTYTDTLPSLTEKGKYKISVYDRSQNEFEFYINISSYVPKVIFTELDNSSKLEVKVRSGGDYNEVMSIKIYRYEVLLNNPNGYDEYLDTDDNELIFIEPSIKQYTFNLGGIYKVVIVDNFDNEIEYLYKFTKDMPIGVLIGVEDGGKTRNDVKFKFDYVKYFTSVECNGNIYELSETEENDIRTQNYYAIDDLEQYFVIKLYDRQDQRNFNEYSFTIKRIKPDIYLFGVEDGQTTSGNVYATWNDDIKKSKLIRNDKTISYTKGNEIVLDGNYSLTITDDIGNENIATFKIDKSLDYYILASEKVSTIDEIKITNKDIQIINNEPLSIYVELNNEVYEYAFGQVFTQEGKYQITIADDFNNKVIFTFELDKTPPIARLHNVENGGKTKGFVYVDWDELELNSQYYVNNKLKGNYLQNERLSATGKYVVEVMDKAGNITKFEFEIDNGIGYSINVANTGITNNNVVINCSEKLDVIVTRNGEEFRYEFGQEIIKNGFYEVILKDDLENTKYFSFTIIKKATKSFEYNFGENIKITSLTCGINNFSFDNVNRYINFEEENIYKIVYKDLDTNKDYTAVFFIDNTPPTIELIGATNGGKTTNDIIEKNPSEEDIEIIAKLNDIEFSYKIGESMRKVGNYEIMVIDSAENFTIYTFEKTYSLNALSIIVIATLIAIGIVIAVCIVRSRKDHYVEIVDK